MIFHPVNIHVAERTQECASLLESLHQHSVRVHVGSAIRVEGDLCVTSVDETDGVSSVTVRNGDLVFLKAREILNADDVTEGNLSEEGVRTRPESSGLDGAKVSLTAEVRPPAAELSLQCSCGAKHPLRYTRDEYGVGLLSIHPAGELAYGRDQSLRAERRRAKLRNALFGSCLNSPTNVKEHAPLSAGANVDLGTEVETTGEHENRAADRPESVPLQECPGHPEAEPPAHGRGWPPTARPDPISHVTETDAAWNESCPLDSIFLGRTPSCGTAAESELRHTKNL